FAFRLICKMEGRSFAAGVTSVGFTPYHNSMASDVLIAIRLEGPVSFRSPVDRGRRGWLRPDRAIQWTEVGTSARRLARREGAMARDRAGPVTRWISALKAGAPKAAQPLWERYFDRLVRLARAQLRESRRGGADADEEDAALSAFDALCRGAAAGRYPQLAD